jgi:predicted Rossmann-fold nucleotide-binding protein
MVWQLMQVKHLPPMPLILMGDMYKEMVEWAKKIMTNERLPLVNPENMQIPTCTNSIDEAVAIIRQHREVLLTQQQSTR